MESPTRAAGSKEGFGQEEGLSSDPLAILSLFLSLVHCVRHGGSSRVEGRPAAQPAAEVGKAELAVKATWEVGL